MKWLRNWTDFTFNEMLKEKVQAPWNQTRHFEQKTGLTQWRTMNHSASKCTQKQISSDQFHMPLFNIKVAQQWLFKLKTKYSSLVSSWVLYMKWNELVSNTVREIWKLWFEMKCIHLFQVKTITKKKVFAWNVENWNVVPTTNEK